MNKVMREHYPVSRLPEDLREEIGDAEYVRLTIDADTPPPPSREALLHLLEKARAISTGVTTEEAVARIRALRDEWDD